MSKQKTRGVVNYTDDKTAKNVRRNMVLSTSVWKISSVEKMVFPVGFEKDTTKDAENIIFHNRLQCALNIFVSIAFYTLKYIFREVYCLGL